AQVSLLFFSSGYALGVKDLEEFKKSCTTAFFFFLRIGPDCANMGTTRLRGESKSLRVDVGLPSCYENRLEHGTAHKPVIMGASHDFRGILGLVYHDLYLGGKAFEEGENMGFDLTKSYLCPSYVEGYREGCGPSCGEFPY
ncbi:hypothetical protein Tco_0664960, partial [Tanacetum coccineum]